MSTGSDTSEFQITKYVFFAGMFLDAVGILLEQLNQHFGKGEGGFLPTVLVIVGSLMAVAKALGYTRSRTMIKLQEAAPATVSGVAEIAPLLKALVAEVKAANQPPTLPSVTELPKP